MVRSPLEGLRDDADGELGSLDLPPGRVVRETQAGVVEEPLLWISAWWSFWWD